MNINELSPGGGMAVADTFNYQREQEKLKQQQALAQSLMKTKMPEGQMVSGWYVAPGAGQYIAAGLDKLMGAYGQYQANEQADGVEKQRTTLLKDALSKFSQVDANGQPVELTPSQKLQYAQTAMELDPDGMGKVIGANAVNNFLNPKSPWEAIPQGGLYNTQTKERIDAAPKQIDPAVQAQREANARIAQDNLDLKTQAANDKREAQKEEVRGKMDQLDKHYTDISTATAAIDKLLTHPGFDSAVGLQGSFMRHMPGSDAATFATLVDQLKSPMFLQTIQAMRGLGALSDAEGAKVEKAIGNLDYNQSKTQFKDTLDAIKQGFANMKAHADNQYRTHGARYKSLGGQIISETEVAARAAKEGWDEKEVKDHLTAQGYKIGK